MVLDATAMSFVTFRICCMGWENVARYSKETQKFHFPKGKVGKCLTHKQKMSTEQFGVSARVISNRI